MPRRHFHRSARPAKTSALPACVLQALEHSVPDQVALELRHRGENRNEKSPNGRRSVQLRPANADEADPACLPVLQGVQTVDRRAPRAVQLPNSDQVDPPGAGYPLALAPAQPPREVRRASVVHVLPYDLPPPAGCVLSDGHQQDLGILVLVPRANPGGESNVWRLLRAYDFQDSQEVVPR